MIRNWGCMLLGLIAIAALGGPAQAQPIYFIHHDRPCGL